MIAQAPLHRPAGIVVLHAIADERGQFAVVHFDGDLHLHFPFGDDQQPPHIFGQIHLIGRAIEIELASVESSHAADTLLGPVHGANTDSAGAIGVKNHNALRRGSSSRTPRPAPDRALPLPARVGARTSGGKIRRRRAAVPLTQVSTPRPAPAIFHGHETTRPFAEH